MKKGIHPQWYPNAQAICACGHVWTLGATVEQLRTDVCSKCHPFFTGEQRIVDTEGQVERFVKRLERAVAAGEPRSKKAARRKERSAIVEIVPDQPA